MAKVELTPEAIRRAVAEFDHAGRTAFLENYGFKAAKDYFLVLEGQNYDSKPPSTRPVNCLGDYG